MTDTLTPVLLITISETKSIKLNEKGGKTAHIKEEFPSFFHNSEINHASLYYLSVCSIYSILILPSF